MSRDRGLAVDWDRHHFCIQGTVFEGPGGYHQKETERQRVGQVSGRCLEAQELGEEHVREARVAAAIHNSAGLTSCCQPTWEDSDQTLPPSLLPKPQ